jgi:membrane dipeptidase
MKRIHVPRHEKGGVNGAVLTVQADWARWTNQYEGIVRQTLEIIDGLHSEVEESGGAMVMARNGSDMETARGQGRFSFLMGLEGGKALEGSLAVLRCYHRLGVRCIGLTHNVRNQLADGAGVRENYGLTGFGRQVIEEVNRLPMVLDLAHVSERGFYEALEVTKSTPIVSHSGCRDLYPFRNGRVPWRSVTDKQIQAIADRGGVIGIACLKHFLTDSPPTSTDFIRHIEHVIQVAGIDHVGTGFDFLDYARPIQFAWLGDGDPETWNGEEDIAVKDFEDITKIPNLTVALIKKGYSGGEISKVLGGNFLRVFKRILG